MSALDRSLRLSLAGAFVLLFAGPSWAQARTRPQAVEVEVAAVLERALSPSDVARAGAELARLGTPVIAPLFGRLHALRSGESASGLTHAAAALGALAQLPRADVLVFLARLARSARDDAERATGLDLLGRVGGRGELKLALEMAAPSDPTLPPAPELRVALESALLGMCARERGAARTLAGYLPRALPAFQAVIAAVVARAGGEEAAALLAAQLGSVGAEIDALLLLLLAEVAGHAPNEDELVRERVRGTLGHPDPRLAPLACLAIEKLRDHEAVPDLIMLLSGRDASLRQRAHAALAGLTGLTLPGEAQPWIAWLDESLAWWDERAEACRVALVSGSAAEAAAAVHEAAGQRLYLRQIVDLLALALQRPEADLVKSACRALGAIPEQAARDALAPLVAHVDLAIADRARAALERHERTRPRAFRPSPASLHARSRIL